MKIKEFHHVCIQTEDYQASLDFYVNLMGFKIIKENRGFHTRSHSAWLEAGNIKIELQTPKKGTTFREWSSLNSGPVHICVVVDDAEEAYNFIKQRGYNDFKIKNGNELYTVEGSKIFKVKAPEGTEIEVRDDPDIS